MNYDILHELINKAQEYETQTGKKLEKEDLSIFSEWLYEKTNREEKIEEKQKLKQTNEPLNSSIGKFIVFMYRFTRFYAKKALENTPLTTVDDLVYLVNIFSKEGSTKTEIIDANIHEKTTGIEILKRLKKNGFIVEQKSLIDGRSKALFITEEGKKIVFTYAGQVRNIGNLIVGDLNEAEKSQLVSLLNRLNDFHQSIYHQNKKESIETLLSFIKK